MAGPLRKKFGTFFSNVPKFQRPLSSRGGGGLGLNGPAIKRRTFFLFFAAFLREDKTKKGFPFFFRFSLPFFILKTYDGKGEEGQRNLGNWKGYNNKKGGLPASMIKQEFFLKCSVQCTMYMANKKENRGAVIILLHWFNYTFGLYIFIILSELFVLFCPCCACFRQFQWSDSPWSWRLSCALQTKFQIFTRLKIFQICLWKFAKFDIT